MHGIAVRSPASPSARRTQWSSDPTDELDFEQFLGLRDTPDRPSPPRARMILIRWGDRTVALTEGSRSCPRHVDILPGPPALASVMKTRKRAPASRRTATVEATAPGALADDGEGLLTTRAAAAYCGYRDAGGIRKARFDGLLVPVGAAANRTLLWRRSDLDAHNRRRRFAPGDVERGEDRDAVQPVGDAGVRPEGDPAASLEAGPVAPAPAAEPIHVASSSAPARTGAAPAIDLPGEVDSPTSAPGEGIAIVPSPLAAPPAEERATQESSDAAPTPSTADPAQSPAAKLAGAATPRARRWRSLAGVLGLVLPPRESLARPSDADDPHAAITAPAGPASRVPRRDASVPYCGNLLAR